jgi:hypothetical protein
MKKETNKLQDESIVKWVKDDPRSVAAMLRGAGDGRQKLYETYCDAQAKLNPFVREEDLVDGYGDFVRRYEALQNRPRPRVVRKTHYESSWDELEDIRAEMQDEFPKLLISIDAFLRGLPYFVCLAFLMKLAAHYL